MFQSVIITDNDVTFVTTDGQSFVIQRITSLSIEFDVADLVVMPPNATRDIHYTISSGIDEITIEAFSSSDIKVKVIPTDAKTGILKIKTSDIIDEYSKVVVLVTNGIKTITRRFIFELGAIMVEDNTTIIVPDRGGLVSLSFFSNVPCSLTIPASDSDWISVVSDTKALVKNAVSLMIQENVSGTRTTIVDVRGKEHASNISISFIIRQDGRISQNKHFLVENEIIHRYLTEVNYEEDFTSSLIESYAFEMGYRMDWPATFGFPANTTGLKLYDCWSDNLLFCGQITSELAGTVAMSFPPNKSLVYELFQDDAMSQVIVADSLTLEGRLHMIKTKNGFNMRDIGGWKTTNGAVLNYGKIFRGGAFSMMSEEDKIVLKDCLHIGVEIDLRSNKELYLEDDNPVNNLNYSLIGSDVDYYHCPLPLSDYLLAHDIYAKVFHIIVKALKDGKSVFIHCAGGADRTGAVCMLLESVLGVVDSDIAKDYELTSFAPKFYDKNNLRYCTKCDLVLTYFADEGEIGETGQERIVNFLINQGVTKQEISDFRRIMLMRETRELN